MGIRPGRLPHAGTPVFGPQTNLARIDMNGHHRRRLSVGRLQSPRFHLLDLSIPLLGPFPAQPFRDPLHMFGTDGQVPHMSQVLRRLLEGLLVRPGVLDLGHQRGTMALGAQGQTLIQEGKELSDIADNGSPPRGR